MRRTLFVVTRGLLPAAVGSVVDGSPTQDASASSTTPVISRPNADGGIDTVSREIVDALTGVELSARELRDLLPHVGGTFTAAPGSKWSAEVSFMSRFLTILGASGEVVRGQRRALADLAAAVDCDDHVAR